MTSDENTDIDTKPWFYKYNVECTSGDTSGSSHCNLDIFLLQSRGIVNSIHNHSTYIFHLLNLLCDLVFVL
jgi:hypothetical protein